MQKLKSNYQQPLVNNIRNVFILLFLISSFGHYACDNKQSKAISTPESTQDSTYVHVQSNVPLNKITRDSTSLIFLTFFYGMSDKEFNEEKDRLVSKGLLTSQHSFEPIKDLEMFIHPRYTSGSTQTLESVSIFQFTISEKQSKKILDIYKDKYGRNFTSKSTSRLSSGFLEPATNKTEAGKRVTNEYSWQLSDGRKIVLELETFTSLYRWRSGPKFESAQKKLHNLGVIDEEDWIKIKSGEIERQINIHYLSKEVVNRNKIIDTKISIEEIERNTKEEKRISKSRNSI